MARSKKTRRQNQTSGRELGKYEKKTSIGYSIYLATVLGLSISGDEVNSTGKEHADESPYTNAGRLASIVFRDFT